MLFKASRLGKLTLLATPMVIGEVYRHLPKLKLKPSDFEPLLVQKIIKLVKNPSSKVIKRCLNLTPDPNDAHVIAGAIVSGSQYLLSLDKKHLLTPSVKKHLTPIQVLSPKEFWQFIAQ